MGETKLARRALLAVAPRILAGLCLTTVARLARAQAAGETTPEAWMPANAHEIPGRFSTTVTVTGTVRELLERSEDTFLYVMLDDFQKPIFVKARLSLGRPERLHKYQVTGIVLRDTADPRIQGGYYILADTQEHWAQQLTPPEEANRSEWAFPAAAGGAVLLGVMGVGLALSRQRARPLLPPGPSKEPDIAKARERLTPVAGTPASGGSAHIPPTGQNRPQAPTEPGSNVPGASTLAQWGTVTCNETGRKVPLVGERIQVGRKHPEVPLPDDDRSISGTHGAFSYEHSQAFYEDRSTNGTLINGERIHKRKVSLHDGATVQIGRSTWTFALVTAAPKPQGERRLSRSLTVRGSSGEALAERHGNGGTSTYSAATSSDGDD